MACKGVKDCWQAPRRIAQQHWCQVPMEKDSSAGRWEGATTPYSTGKGILGKDSANTFICFSFYSLIGFLLSKGELSSCKSHQGTAWLFLTMVSINTIIYFTACRHLKLVLHEVYGRQFPCWGSPHRPREVQRKRESILSEARAGCTKANFSRVTPHLHTLSFLRVLHEGQPAFQKAMRHSLIKSTHRTGTSFINSVTAIIKRHNQKGIAHAHYF